MPGGDGTGPMGLGPRTGRGAGFCSGFGMPGFMNPMPRSGWSRGFGRGRGWFGRGRGFGWRRWGFTPIQPAYHMWEPVYPQPQPQPQPTQLVQPYQPTKAQELQMLEDEAKAIEQEQNLLKQELEAVKKRIEELEIPKPKK